MILLQINFKYPAQLMGEQLVEAATPLAHSINNEPGFISKVWIENAMNDLLVVTELGE